MSGLMAKMREDLEEVLRMATIVLRVIPAGGVGDGVWSCTRMVKMATKQEILKHMAAISQNQVFRLSQFYLGHSVCLLV